MAKTLHPRMLTTLISILWVDEYLRANDSWVAGTLQELTGFEVTLVATDYEAEQALSIKRFNIVIASHKLEGSLKHGFELLQDLKRVNPELRTILATGYDASYFGDDLLKKVDAFFDKPTDLEELAKLLCEWFGKT